MMQSREEALQESTSVTISIKTVLVSMSTSVKFAAIRGHIPLSSDWLIGWETRLGRKGNISLRKDVFQFFIWAKTIPLER